MRIALASLLAAAAFVSVAQAQTPAPPTAPAAQPATPPTPPAPPPTSPAAPGTAPAAPAAPGANPAAPPAPGAQPAAQPATPAAPAVSAIDEAKSQLPTSGDAAAILQILDKVCVPLVRGGNFEQLMKANGFRLNRRDNTWSAQLGTTSKDYSVTFAPLGVNKDVCRAEVHFASGEDTPIVKAINVWAFLHQPQMDPTANYVAVDPDGIKRVRRSWEHLDSTSSIGVNFSVWTKPDDSPLNSRYATGELYYQERKLG